MEEVERLFEALRPVSLDAMNERAALQRRTDNKYLVTLDDVAGILDDLAGDLEVLEIDGDRAFDYESVYFDTPSLRSFREHIRDDRPRYKTRTRCYVTTGDCFFEVKVKLADGEMVKRNVDHSSEERDRLDDPARELVEDVLGECGLDDVGGELKPSLITRFKRVTVVGRDAPERTTFDFGVTLNSPDGDTAELDERYVIAETKTPDGRGAWDRAFAASGKEPVSLSKYRIGMGLLHAPDEDSDYARDLKRLFEVRAASR